jgi:hypothetical protein
MRGVSRRDEPWRWAYNAGIGIYWSGIMSELEKLAERIGKLSPEELREFRAWFAEFDARLWDAQIETDAKAGKLDGLIAEALAEHKAGKTREL